MNHFIWNVPAMLTTHECREFISWAERYPRDAERPQPIVREIEGGVWGSSGIAKVETQLRNYAGSLNIDVYDGPARLRVLQYRPGDHIPWHPDFRPHEVNFKVSVSICLEPGAHQLEYVASEGVATFVGQPGDAVFFPSWVAHRVVPREGVVLAQRWSLAAWLRGPEYR